MRRLIALRHSPPSLSPAQPLTSFSLCVCVCGGVQVGQRVREPAVWRCHWRRRASFRLSQASSRHRTRKHRSLSLCSPLSRCAPASVSVSECPCAQSEGAHAASDANTDTASVSTALLASAHTRRPYTGQPFSQEWETGGTVGSDDWNPRCVLTDHSPSHGWGGAKCRIVPSIRSWHAMTQCLAHVIETQAILSIPGNTPIHTDRQTDRHRHTERRSSRAD
jgi:hypothetical protein